MKSEHNYRRYQDMLFEELTHQMASKSKPKVSKTVLSDLRPSYPYMMTREL